MKQILITYIALVFNFTCLHAQQTVSTSGGVGSGTGGSISYSVGQVDYQTNTNTVGTITQGVQQPYEIFGFTVTGYYTYDNTSNTPLDSVWLYLKCNGNTLDSTQTDLNGYFRFDRIHNGFYIITASTHKPWNGVNATDAVKVKRHFAGSELFTSSIRLHAADVNLSFGINTTDAVKITRRFVGSDTSFTRGDWLFEKPFGGDTLNVSVNMNDTIIVNGINLVQNFKGLCVGDVNGSNLPNTGAKSPAKVILNYKDIVKLNSNEIYELPIKMANKLNIGAISLILNYPKELVKINNIQLVNANEKENLFYNVISNDLRIGWYEANDALKLNKDESLIIIKLKTTNNFKTGDVIKFNIENNSLCEFADENGNSINNVVLNTSSIEHINSSAIPSIVNSLNNDMEIFPNPAKDIVNIKYFIANDGLVKIEIFNVLGVKIIDVLNKQLLEGNYNSELNLSSIPPGVYTCIMKLENKSIIIKRLVISK